MSDNQEYREWIAQHLFYIDGDVGLPRSFSTVQTVTRLEELRGNLAISDQANTLSTSDCQHLKILFLLLAHTGLLPDLQRRH